MASRTRYLSLKVSLCLTLFVESISQEGKIILFFRSLYSRCCRDVTDHLQLLLRKSGNHLHTTAEREVVRTIKEKCCYIALNPAKEEKEAPRIEEFRLPDGHVIEVNIPPFRLEELSLISNFWFSLVMNVSVRPKFSLIPKSLGRNTLGSTKLLSIQ